LPPRRNSSSRRRHSTPLFVVAVSLPLDNNRTSPASTLIFIPRLAPVLVGVAPFSHALLVHAALRVGVSFSVAAGLFFASRNRSRRRHSTPLFGVPHDVAPVLVVASRESSRRPTLLWIPLDLARRGWSRRWRSTPLLRVPLDFARRGWSRRW